MDVEKLQKLAERYPEVRELLKDNYSLSVSAMAARMEVWKEKVESRLQAFDANHTRAQAGLVEFIKQLECLIKQLEVRLQSAAIFSRELQKRVKKLEAKKENEQGQPKAKKVGSA